MRCFELKGTEVRDGLLIQYDDEGARIDITSDGEFCFPLSEKLTKFLRTKVPRVAPVRLTKTQVEDGYLTVEERKNYTALVRLELRAPKDGVVRLTATSYDEFIRYNRVAKQFHPFPSTGITVHGRDDIDPTVPDWLVGASFLELAVVMDQNASFRIQHVAPMRQESSPEFPSEVFVRWDGFRLDCHVPSYIRRAAGPKMSTEVTAN